jgi:hypothetical protein
MSSKVKERLKKLALEMSHEERITLDEALDKMAMKLGMIVVGRGCDTLIESIPDDKLIEIVEKIKKKKKKLLEVTS